MQATCSTLGDSGTNNNASRQRDGTELCTASSTRSSFLQHFQRVDWSGATGSSAPRICAALHLLTKSGKSLQSTPLLRQRQPRTTAWDPRLSIPLLPAATMVPCRAHRHRIPLLPPHCQHVPVSPNLLQQTQPPLRSSQRALHTNASPAFPSTPQPRASC